MKSGLIAIALACCLAPSLAWGQAPCKCSPRSATIIRPYFPIEYPEYEPPCHGIGRQQQRWPYTVNSTAGGVPISFRNAIRRLDCLIPAGPRSGHGAGITCFGAGSGCIKGAAHRDMIYCPYCGAPPFHCNCCGNGKAIYAPPATLMHASHCEPAYFEEQPIEEPQAAPKAAQRPR
jgi:hypothetical protein